MKRFRRRSIRNGLKPFLTLIDGFKRFWTERSWTVLDDNLGNVSKMKEPLYLKYWIWTSIILYFKSHLSLMTEIIIKILLWSLIIQQDINELQNRAKTWQMSFKNEKFKVMHFGRKNTENEYTMVRGRI